MLHKHLVVRHILLAHAQVGKGPDLDENTRSNGTPGTPASEEFMLGRFFASLLFTTRDVLLSPRRFFDGLAPEGLLWPPVLYFMVCYLTLPLVNLIAILHFSSSRCFSAQPPARWTRVLSSLCWLSP